MGYVLHLIPNYSKLAPKVKCHVRGGGRGGKERQAAILDWTDVFFLMPLIRRTPLNQLRDFVWHQICATWSGFNGVVRYYLDGKEFLSDRNPTRGELRGGKSLTVGTDDYLLTEFNVWDRVLTEQEIENNAKKCDGGKGNVIQWHQGFEYLKKYEKTYNTPSVCEAPSANTGQGAPSESVPPPENDGSG